MKKYLGTIGVSLMITLTATTLSAAAIAEDGIASDRCCPLWTWDGSMGSTDPRC